MEQTRIAQTPECEAEVMAAQRRLKMKSAMQTWAWYDRVGPIAVGDRVRGGLIIERIGLRIERKAEKCKWVAWVRDDQGGRTHLPLGALLPDSAKDASPVVMKLGNYGDIFAGSDVQFRSSKAIWRVASIHTVDGTPEILLSDTHGRQRLCRQPDRLALRASCAAATAVAQSGPPARAERPMGVGAGGKRKASGRACLSSALGGLA